MKKLKTNAFHFYFKKPLQVFLFSVFFLLFSSTLFAFTTNQILTNDLNIEVKNTQLLEVDEVFNLLKEQTPYNFIYPSNLFKNTPAIQVNKGLVKANDLLEACLKNQNVTITSQGQFSILITPVKNEEINFQQQQILTGKVSDEEGFPLMGVSILIEGTTRGAATNENGEYSLEVSPGDILDFSFVGFKTFYHTVTATDKVLDVVLKVDTNEISEIVIIGYGKSKKEDLTGSVGVIETQELHNTVQTSVENIIGGKVAGVNVTRTGGAPGAGASIQIRGFSTLKGSNEPLYVVDGIPFQPGLDDTSQNINPLSFLNPSDISSMVVLKDASSTAIYGSRAANGVVMITTKKGISGDKPTFEVDLNSTMQLPIFRTDLLNRDQFLDVLEEAYTNANLAFDRDAMDLGADTNWIDESTQSALMTTLNLGVRGATQSGKTTYASSLSYTGQEGVVQPSDFERYSARVNLDSKISNKFKVGTNLNYIFTERDGGPSFARIAFQRPDMPRDFSGYNSQYNNYLLQAEKGKRLAKSDVFFGAAFAELELAKNLTAKSAFNVNKLSTASYNFRSADFERDGIAKRNDLDYQKENYVWDNTLNYNNTFSGTHHLDAVAGGSWNQEIVRVTSIESQGFSNEDFLFNLGSADNITNYSSSESVSGLASFFARVSYNYSSKYYVTLTGRADKSSKFGPKNRWGYFPSAGAAWDISKENFWNSNAVNYLKLRSSIGVTGLASFPDFLYTTLYQTGAFYNGSNGFAPTGIPNKDIRWEKTTQIDAGLDFGFLNNAFTGSIGYYSKKTKDLILNVPIPLEPGGGSQQVQNVGDITNSGIEFEISAGLINTDDFTWDASFNITYQTNTIDKLNGGTVDDFSYTYLEEGKALGSFLGYKSDGLIQTQAEMDALNNNAPDGYYMPDRNAGPGDRKIVDYNGDGEITTEDRQIIGNALPDFYGGLNTSVGYKNFHLAANFQYQIGAELIPDILRTSSNVSSNTSIVNYTTATLDAWTPTNTNTNQPRNYISSSTFNNYYALSEMVQDASFIKLKNIRLTYNFGDYDFLYGGKMAVYLSASDLFTITKYEGEDPEIFSASAVSQGNIEFGKDPVHYPYSTTVSVGLNVKF